MSSLGLLSAPEDETHHASWDDLWKTLDDWAVEERALEGHIPMR